MGALVGVVLGVAVVGLLLLVLLGTGSLLASLALALTRCGTRPDRAAWRRARELERLLREADEAAAPARGQPPEAGPPATRRKLP